MTVASVPDPVAPVITLPVPDGRKSARGSGDVALTAPGPAGMSVRVTITPTDLEAGPGGVAFADRITHVWTNTRSFLVVIHLEGPVGAPGFDAAKSTTMQQFAVVIP
ncbi:hypothetical protein A5787_16710 [Mycobacterium sp. 852002-50816_SCH5313054-b]|nr:hypothetical protein A5787_16710 [Mycobacterium sp. 852002-50816_SCH5313054-b]